MSSIDRQAFQRRGWQRSPVQVGQKVWEGVECWWGMSRQVETQLREEGLRGKTAPGNLTLTLTLYLTLTLTLALIQE